MLVLTAKDVRQAINMQQAIDAVETAYVQAYQQKAQTPLRTQVDCPQAGGTMLFMPAAMQELQGIGIKIVSVFPNNVSLGKPTIAALMLLSDPQTGEPLAFMDAGFMTALRTGAGSGVATRHLARRDARKTAVFGAGTQAVRQLEAVLEERDIQEVLVFDIDQDRARAYIQECSQELSRFNVDLQIAESPRQAVLDADIIIAATTSASPVFSGQDIKAGVHINGIGSFKPEMQEIDETAISRADKIVIDSFQAAFAEAGDLIIPVQKGLLSQDDIYGEIGKIACGDAPGRQSQEEITFFKSVGIAAQDIAVSKLIYENAKARGLGSSFEL